MPKKGRKQTSSKNSSARVRRAIALLGVIAACLVAVLILLPPAGEPETVEGPGAVTRGGAVGGATALAGLVADGHHEVERFTVEAAERLADEPGRVDPPLAEDLRHEGVDVAGRRAPGGADLAVPVPVMSPERLREGAPARVAGTDDEDAHALSRSAAKLQGGVERTIVSTLAREG